MHLWVLRIKLKSLNEFLYRRISMNVIACVGAVVVDSVENPTKLLLVKRGTNPWRGLWTNPAGKIEAGETLEDAIKREVLEEAGIQVEVVEHLCTFDEFVYDLMGRLQTHYVCVNYLVCPVGGTLKAGTDIADVQWVTLQEARALFEEGLVPDVTIRPFPSTKISSLKTLFAKPE
jgi:8-oxo-dGTP diphosphatase